MKTFAQFIAEGSIRQGLPHITTMNHGQFKDLLHKDGRVHIHDVTEKTDGMTHVMGHDEHGFYTQSSGSGNEKMRSPEDFHTRAKRRAEETGKPYNPTAANAFAHVHKMMQSNKAVTDHLAAAHEKHGEAKIRGEVFYKPMGTPSETHKHEIKFVGTSYDPSHMAEHGKYVIHTKLPDNHHVDAEAFKKHSTPHINFDDDKTHITGGHVDASAEHKEFHALNHDLINSRTVPKNKEAKLAEVAKMAHIQKKVAGKVDDHVKKLGVTPKWGSGSEGLVIHPSKHNPNAPRFKVTSDAFRAYRADPKTKDKWKK